MNNKQINQIQIQGNKENFPRVLLVGVKGWGLDVSILFVVVCHLQTFSFSSCTVPVFIQDKRMKTKVTKKFNQTIRKEKEHQLQCSRLSSCNLTRISYTSSIFSRTHLQYRPK